MAKCLALEVVCAECSDQQEEQEAEGGRGSHRWAMERRGERMMGRKGREGGGDAVQERVWYRGRR